MTTHLKSFAVLSGLISWSAAPLARAQDERPTAADLIATLNRTDATLHDKARACQQLGEFGGREAVPALAALLPDKALSAYARSGLEGIPDPAAAGALRSALRTLKGNLLTGVVNSLGVLRDAASVSALSKLAGDPASGAAKEALLALGRISNDEAIRVLQRALTTGPEALRPDAAAGSLLTAEQQRADGKDQTAVSLYDAVRTANVPVPYRIAGTRGSILARKSDGVDLLVKILKSDDREARNVGLHTAREMTASTLAKPLRAELETAKVEVQAQIIEAIADCCRDSGSVAIIRDAASSQHADVRQAAFKALGKTGDRTAAPILLKALLSARNPAESSAAADSLARLPGAEVDALILQSLASATDPVSRVALIDLLDARPPSTAATPRLLELAGDPDLSVSLAALRALRSFAGESELPALIALTRTYKDGSQRGAAENALYYASTVMADSSRAGEVLLAALNKSGEDLDKASFIKTLSLIGYGKALPSITANLRDSNSWLVTTTIDSLGKWPGPAPIDDVLRVVETSLNADARARALNAAIQLSTPAPGRPQASDAKVAEFFRRVSKTARSVEDKRMIIAGLGRWRTAESLRLLEPYLDDPDMKTAAAYAIADAAQPLAAGRDYAVVKPFLQRLSGIQDRALIDRIENLRSTIAATEAAMKKPAGHQRP